MILPIAPNRTMVLAVFGLVFYAVLSMVLPWMLLRDIFNSLAFGGAFIITLTWFSAAVRSIKENMETGESQLILAIFFLWLVAFLQRCYAIIYNYNGQPDAWSQSAISGFWPYSYFICAILFLISPGFAGAGPRTKAYWSIIAAVGLGGMVAGFLIGMQVSTE